ncbi:mesoderm induction early response protein 1 [Clonorchis sinensis]|uniref:Mesoderm induction early response protein 1 n=1 Tax=Clonorchis sinensis TaxID=79923 RepID=G7YT42_CLOSI|nr:mesoderm induction early response protein 1 [Clonorchis sinensis]
MSEKPSSDAASDSDFDEQDLTADEDDDDSIAADEDAADEEEINSLVKESEMSLEELLASYGVSVSEMAARSAAAQASTSSTTRSSRLRSARQTKLVPPHPSPPHAQQEEELKVVTDILPNKRVRRSTNSSSPSVPLSVDQESHYSAPLSPRLSPGHHLIENTKPHSTTHDHPDTRLESAADFDPTTGSLSQPEKLPSDPANPTNRKRHRASSLTLIPDKQNEHEIGHGSRTVQDEDVSTATRADRPLSQPHTDPNSEDEEVDRERAADSSSLRDDGDGRSRDSDHDETFSLRFWKKAIGAGESPASYNSEEDEDYAPSVESGPDWRGEIRVGDEYQACVAPSLLNSSADLTSDWWDTRRFENESSRLWQPDKLPEADVIHFEQLFAQTAMCPVPNDRTVDDEEALFLLMRCNYDPDEALQRLRFRTVAPSEIPGYMDTWSEADSAAFEKGFALYNKDFRQIRDTRLRHKTVGELVHYYYLWKKTARHDEFARVYRRDKRKSPHPSITDFMDYLVLEQEASAESYPYTMNSDQFRINNHHNQHHHHHRHHQHHHIGICSVHKMAPSAANAVTPGCEGSGRTAPEKLSTTDSSWSATDSGCLPNGPDKTAKTPSNPCGATDISPMALSATTAGGT